MENPAKQASSYREDMDVDAMEFESTWQWWNQFRIVCDYDRKLIVALIVSHDLPEEQEVSNSNITKPNFYIFLKKYKNNICNS